MLVGLRFKVKKVAVLKLDKIIKQIVLLLIKDLNLAVAISTWRYEMKKSTKLKYSVLSASMLIAGNLFASEFNCDEMLQKYPVECKVQQEYKEIKKKLANRGVDVENLTEAKATRFIGHGSLNRAAKNNEFLVWEIYDPKPKTWLKWEEGNYSRELISRELECLQNKGSKWEFTKDHLKRMYLGAMDASLTGKLDKNIFIKHKFPKPGEFRSEGHLTSGFFVPKKWNLSDEDKKDVDNYDLKRVDGSTLVTSKLYKVPGVGIVGEVEYVDSKEVEAEVDELLALLNDGVNKYLSNDYMPITPLEFMADIQRRYVSIHPFHEGNGRMSRFLQDILSRVFNLPYLPNADLKEDVINNMTDYRKETVQAMKDHIKGLKKCLNQYENNMIISNKCRPMYENYDAQESVETENKKIAFKQLLDSNLATIDLKTPNKCE